MEIKEIDGQQKSQENIFGVEITIKDVIWTYKGIEAEKHSQLFHVFLSSDAVLPYEGGSKNVST